MQKNVRKIPNGPFASTTWYALAMSVCECDAVDDLMMACPICMLPLDIGTYNDVEQGAVAPIQTSCGHLFCVDCLRSAAKRSPACPLCRSDLHLSHDNNTITQSCALCVAKVHKRAIRASSFGHSVRGGRAFIIYLSHTCGAYARTSDSDESTTGPQYGSATSFRAGHGKHALS